VVAGGTYLLGLVPSQSQPEVQLGPAVRGSRDYARRRGWEGQPQPPFYQSERADHAPHLSKRNPFVRCGPTVGWQILGNTLHAVGINSNLLLGILSKWEWTYLRRARFAISSIWNETWHFFALWKAAPRINFCHTLLWKNHDFHNNIINIFKSVVYARYKQIT